jgi:hypothetical protein
MPITGKIIDWKKYYTPPFIFKVGRIVDSNNRTILEFPGWVNVGGLEPEDARNILYSIGKEIEEALNKPTT